MMRHRDLDDKAIAGVIGFILVFAGLITYAAYVAHSEVPKWGEQNERAYDAQVSDVLAHMASAAAAGLGSGASTTTVVPAPPGPPIVNVPLIDQTQGAPPSAAVSLLPNCASLTATHVSSTGGTVNDTVAGATGCVQFSEQGTYAGSFVYREEFGGLVREEAGKSFVVAGPTLSLKIVNGSPTTYHVGVTFLDVQGAANSAGVGRSGSSLDLVPGPSTTESSEAANAQNVTWTLNVVNQPADAQAWSAWFNGQIRAAGFDTSCNQANLTASTTVQVQVSGPCASPPGTADVALSISYGRFDATLR